MAPSAMEWDSQAAQLRAQAREAEEASAQLKACLAAATLSAQAQGAEIQAREVQECFARRANAGNPQSMPIFNAGSSPQQFLPVVNTGNLQSVPVQNFPPSAAELDTQADKLTFQAREAEEAARLMRAKARELQGVSVQNSLQVTASVAAPTPQAPVPMVQCVPVFPVCFPMDFQECAEVSTAREIPTVYKQEQENSQPHGAASAFTTLMLRNLPNSYTRDMLIKLLDQEGLQGSYDLVFVPVDFRGLASLGYGFVNFTSNENAERAKEKLQGFNSWQVAHSNKVCEVAWGSHLQGLNAHIKHYRNSPVMHKSVPECYKPVLFKGGVRQAFPGPTKQIRPPRVKAYTQ